MKILDNASGQTAVIRWLRDNIQEKDTLRFVSAYFSIYGYEALKKELEGAKMRFLFGEPGNVGNVDPTPQKEKSFYLEKDMLRAEHPLMQRGIARECEKWVKRKDTEIRTVQESNFLHGKMYHLQHNGDTPPPQAVSGSSNFTKNGLGAAATSNLELNLIAEADATGELESWFDALWHDEERTRDAKPDVLEALRKLGADQTPEFIYYKTLYHRFEDRLRFIDENKELLDNIPYDETLIWQKLYEFQKRGAIGAINRLLQHNGCIIADSVGLGKTYSALAIIKYFELRNENVLVLCPKRLRENWTRYQAATGNKNNPFAEDKFQYHVLSHTDLGRETGEVGSINLANINWGTYSLVVIDESHNFRNAPSSKQTDDPNARKSRYQFLMDEVIKAGAHTKVLMLSATPVNNRLQDLANQILLFSGNDDHHFSHSLEIPSLRQVMLSAQREFLKWQEIPNHERKKEDLLNALDEHFYRILDAVTIARSRHHLTAFYPEFVADGGFPQKEKPVDKHPATDSENELQYRNMAERIEALGLAIYYPSNYLAEDSALHDKLREEKEELNYDQRNREQSLIYMMRTNFLKRLESSVDAYRESLGRVHDKIETMLQKIAAAKNAADTAISDDDTAPDEADTEDNDDYIAGGKKWKYRLKDLDVPRWQKALEADKEAVASMLATAQRVTVERDAKLTVLREVIGKKIANPTTDKDGKINRKVLIFTTFADTAKYLYKELHEWAQAQGCHIAQIAGSGDVRTTLEGKLDYADILDRFAPQGRECEDGSEQIDILIATDCISEGQNLQDCDLVINYDVHWNPVRIIQRFGRIDRLNSRNKSLSMINFWPDIEMEQLLGLQRRVLTRMELANIAATGHDNLLENEGGKDGQQPDDVAEPSPTEKKKGQLDLALDYRDQQMRRLHEEILETGQKQGELDMSDFTLDDFLADLRAYMEKSGKALEEAPLGLFSLTPPHESGDSGKQHAPGILFCLRRKPKEGDPPDTLPPCRLVYMKDDETVSLGNHALAILRGLARDRDQANLPLARWFDKKTDNGRDMQEENECLLRAIKQITQGERKTEAKRASTGGLMEKRGERVKNADDYELITWLVVRSEP